MNYFAAGLYGDYSLYTKIKKLLKDDDHLWIIGDILDGNNSCPWDGIKILEDIYNSQNVTLILGDHEYNHVMYLISCESEDPEEDEAEEFREAVLSMDISGEDLLNYEENTLTGEERTNIIGMISQSNVSKMIKIGDSFFYLCHGTPTMCQKATEENVFLWQKNVAEGEFSFEKDYLREILSDPIEEFTKEFRGEIMKNRPFIITGHSFVPDLEEDGETVVDGIVFRNRKFAINPGIIGEDEEDRPFPVLAIDAAGYFIRKVR